MPRNQCRIDCSIGVFQFCYRTANNASIIPGFLHVVGSGNYAQKFIIMLSKYLQNL